MKYVYEFLNVDASTVQMLQIAIIWSSKMQLASHSLSKFFIDFNVH